MMQDDKHKLGLRDVNPKDVKAIQKWGDKVGKELSATAIKSVNDVMMKEKYDEAAKLFPDPKQYVAAEFALLMSAINYTSSVAHSCRGPKGHLYLAAYMFHEVIERALHIHHQGEVETA